MRQLCLPIQHNTESTLHLTVKAISTLGTEVSPHVFVLAINFFVIQARDHRYSLSSWYPFFVSIHEAQIAPSINDITVKVVAMVCLAKLVFGLPL
jgi:hypothetical protein